MSTLPTADGCADRTVREPYVGFGSTVRPIDLCRYVLPVDEVCEDPEADHDDLLRHVPWVRLERDAVRIRSAVKAAAKPRFGYGFQMPGAPPHARRDSLPHHRLHRLAAPDAGR